MICNKNVFVKQNGLTPLHLAAQDDRVGVTEVLLNQGADIDGQTKVSVQHLLCFNTLHKKTDAEKSPQKTIHVLSYTVHTACINVQECFCVRSCNLFLLYN